MNTEQLIADFNRLWNEEKMNPSEAIETAIWEQEAPTSKTRLLLEGYFLGIIHSERVRRARDNRTP